MPETNPLVAERKDTTTPLAGTFLLEDGEALVQAINDKDWVAGGLALVGGAFDAAAAASDPIGTLIAMGLGWVLDHVQPFTTWLEQLTGDADQVTAHATTWKNVQQHLHATAETMASHVTTDLADMTGTTITAYRGAAGDITRVINAAGTWAGAIGTALDITAFIVQFVHDFVRDAISEVVGSILSYAAELIATVGLAWPIVAEQIATRIASLIGQVGRNVKNLVTSARNLVKKLTDLKTLFHTLKNKIDDLFRNLGHHTNNLSDTSRAAGDAGHTAGNGGAGSGGGSGTTNPTSGTNTTGTTGGATSTSGGATLTGSGADYSKGTPHPSDGKTNNTAPAGVTSNSSVGATSPGEPSAHSSENLGSSSLGGGNSTHHPAGDANTHLTDNNVTSPHGSSSHTNSGTGHTNPTSGGANTPTHADSSHATMTADSAPPTNNNTPHTGNTTTPDGTPGHTTGEPNTPKRALDDDPTTHPTDPVTIEPRHAEEPPQTSSGGGDDHNNHGGGGGDDHNNHGDGDDHNNHGDGDDHNNHGDDGTDTELDRLRNQPPETIDDALKVIREPRPYDGPNADVGKVMDDSTGLVDNPKEIFGTTDGKPNSYNDWANEYLDEQGSPKWPDPEELPVENGLDKTKGIERYDNIDDYISEHGTRVDRVGGPFGSYLGGIDDGRVATFEERAISPESVKQSYYQYELTGELPEGHRIDRGIVYPWHGTAGGASQVQIFGPSGRALSVNELLDAGILKGATDFVGLPWTTHHHPHRHGHGRP